jgi:hypothetical protein
MSDSSNSALVPPRATQKADLSERNQATEACRIRLLVSRYSISEPLAVAVAELAFSTGGA